MRLGKVNALGQSGAAGTFSLCSSSHLKVSLISQNLVRVNGLVQSGAAKPLLFLFIIMLLACSACRLGGAATLRWLMAGFSPTFDEEN